jgi:RecB family exonuclease
VTARFVFDWTASDGAFFRALDVALARAGGGASVVVPDASVALDASREESPHEVVADACARALDAPPRFAPARVGSTWSGALADDLRARTSIVAAADLDAEAAACAAEVRRALDCGVPADAIAIALPLRGGAPERVLSRALLEHGVIASRADDALSEAPLVAAAFAAFEADAPARATRAQYVQHAMNVWGATGFGEGAGVGAFGVLSTDAAEDEVGRAELDAIARSAAAWDALRLTEYVSASKRLRIWDAEIPRDTFVFEALTTMPPPRDPTSRRAGAVRVGTLLDAVGLPIELLVVMGANEGAFDGEDPHGIDDELVLRLARERAAAGAVKIASCLDAAARVAFTYRTRDRDGGELAPAAFVAWLVRGGAPLAMHGASPFAPGRDSPRDRRLRAIAFDPESANERVPSASARSAVERERERYFLDASRRSSELVGALPWREPLSQIVTAETGGAERALSVTAVERIASCPFVGFAECVAGAREAAVEQRLPDAREEGTLVHAALAAAFSACGDLLDAAPARRDVSAIVARGEEAARAVFPEKTPDVTRGRVLASVATLLRIAAEDAHHRFLAAEQSFGTEGAPWPAFVIECNGERLVVRGSIDRVDVTTDGSRVRVIDYKRRKNTIKKAARHLGVTSLQVPLYAKVASRALGKAAGESGFLPTEPKDLHDIAPPKSLAAGMQNLLAESDGLSAIEKRALDVVGELRRGTFLPNPATNDVCARCAHDGACRKPRFTIEPEEP